MTAAQAAFGVTLSRAGQPVAEILEMGNIKFDRDFIDVTNHGSSGGYEEFIAAAIIKTGELPIKCNYIIGDTNGQIAIKSDWANKTASAYTITFPNGQGFSGNAIITNYEYETQIDKQIIFNATLKWSGALTDAVTASNNCSALAITTATLYPVFAAATYDYVAVSIGDTCTVTATFVAGTAALYRAGVFVQALLTATPSGAISLGADGANTELQIIVQETGKAAKTYTIDVANAAA